jgi:hypothetical protein
LLAFSSNSTVILEMLGAFCRPATLPCLPNNPRKVGVICRGAVVKDAYFH